MPDIGDELHHFGWNACSAALCPSSPRPHVERRYLLVPGLRSSRMHVMDVKPEPRAPKIVKTIEADSSRAARVLAGPTRSTAVPTPSMCRPRRRQRRRGRRRHHAARLRLVRSARRVGGRPRAAEVLVRLLVAPRPRHVALQRMGHAGDVRVRGRARATAGPASTATTCTCGISGSAGTSRRSISVTPIRWCSNCVRRTIPARPTGSSASSCRSRICRPRCGCGTVMAPSGRSRR